LNDNTDLRKATIQEKVNILFHYILDKMKIDELTVSTKIQDTIKSSLQFFCLTLATKWNNSHRKKANFLKFNSLWLEKKIIFPKEFYSLCNSSSKESLVKSTGRPRKAFLEKLPKSQRKEAIELSNSEPTKKLLMGAAISAKQNAQPYLAEILDEAMVSPNRPMKIAKKIRDENRLPVPYTPEEALNLFLDLNLTKRIYTKIREEALKRNADIYPSYNCILKAKNNCRPIPLDCIKISETCATLPLQNLLDHTARRIVELQSNVFHHGLELNNKKTLNVVLHSSWGFDGSSGHSNYHQKYQTEACHMDDKNLFATTMIPLELISNNNVIYWRNRIPQSYRFCRPIKLEYVKESAEVILRQKREIEEEISRLEDVEIILDNTKSILVKFQMHLTLIDGKVLNTITGTPSMQTCAICGATPTRFNDSSLIENDAFMPNEKSLIYGISPLHSWIRCMELFLHISYRLPLKVWQVRGEKNKELMKKRKVEIHNRLRENMGLIVDVPIAGGSGTSNTGNTARRAFKDYDKFARCLDIDKELVKKFQILLISLTCQLPIDPILFGKYCLETAQLYVKLYSWFYMPASIHKLLMHGKDIIRCSILPLGFLGEEASEARNKFYKHDRLFHSRKMNRTFTMHDQFYRAMDSSDPKISSISIVERINARKHLKLPAEVLNLLECPQIPKLPSRKLEYEDPNSKDSEDEDFDLILPYDFDEIELQDSKEY